MTEANKHGLPRRIPEQIARQVRQECGFGCIICGRLPYTYDHFSPEYVEAKTHDPQGIALLCFNHHAERRGRLATSTVAKFRKNPICLRSGTASYERPLFMGGSVTFDIGGNLFSGTRCQLALGGRVLFGISAPVAAGEPWKFDGDLRAGKGAAVLSFKEDELKVATDNWDVTLEGKLLQINRGSGEIVLRVEFDGPANTVRLTRLRLGYSSGLEVEVGPGFIDLRNLRHTRKQNRMDHLRMEGATIQGVARTFSPFGVGIDAGDVYQTYFKSITLKGCVGVGPDGLADLSAIATLDEFLSPDQLD